MKKALPSKKTATKIYLEKCRKKDCEQAALGTAGEDRGGITREMNETSGIWTMPH